ncbi:MAG: hypothetical protein RLY37_767 [Verrucomicrobiota bacterium]|jgi:hypothetical protein
MSSGGKAWIGSVAVHLGVVVAIIGFSWYAARHGGETIEAYDPILVDLNGIPGKRPGEIGKVAGVAKGSESGSNSGVARIHLKKLDVDKILRDRAQAEQAAQSSTNSPKTMTKAASKSGTSSNNPKKMTLGEFNNTKGGKAGSASKVGGIGGVSVKKGRSYGEGDNGGDGGSASERQLYAGEVEAKLRSAWNEILAAEGASIASAGSCGVTVAIDASGFASFSGWVNSPSDSRMAELVKRACGRIGNCGKPPGGKAFKIDFSKISASDG